MSPYRALRAYIRLAVYWVQDHQCCICGKPTKRRLCHWKCELPLLGPLL